MYVYIYIYCGSPGDCNSGTTWGTIWSTMKIANVHAMVKFLNFGMHAALVGFKFVPGVQNGLAKRLRQRVQARNLPSCLAER